MSQVQTPPAVAAVVGTEKPAKKKNSRIPYMDDSSRAAVKNEAGQLTECPLDYSASHNLPPGKTAFASETTYWLFRVMQAEIVLERAKESLHLCKTCGTPEQRKKRTRMAKIREELEKLEAEFGVSE